MKLSRGEAISTSDEQWLDNEGNTINEERILETLELAPDYNRAVAELDSNGQEIVRKLRDWAGLCKLWVSGVSHNFMLGHRPRSGDLAQQIEILDWHDKNGKNQSATARHFGPLYPNLRIKQPLISSWRRNPSTKVECLCRSGWSPRRRKAQVEQWLVDML